MQTVIIIITSVLFAWLFQDIDFMIWNKVTPVLLNVEVMTSNDLLILTLLLDFWTLLSS